MRDLNIASRNYGDNVRTESAHHARADGRFHYLGPPRVHRPPSRGARPRSFLTSPLSLRGVTNPYFKFVQKLAEMGIIGRLHCRRLHQYARAVLPERFGDARPDGGFPDGRRIQSVLNPTAPIITQLSPTVNPPGATPFTLTVTGLNTHFAQGGTTILSDRGLRRSERRWLLSRDESDGDADDSGEHAAGTDIDHG